MNDILKALKQIAHLVNHYKDLLVIVVMVAGLGLAGYQIYQDLNVTPDKAYLDEQTQKATEGVVKIDTAVIDAVRKQANVTAQPDLSNLGKSDPFSP